MMIYLMRNRDWSKIIIYIRLFLNLIYIYRKSFSQDFFSLSSCSGRIVVFAEGGRTEHTEPDQDQVQESNKDEIKEGKGEVDEDKLKIVKVSILNEFDLIIY